MIAQPLDPKLVFIQGVRFWIAETVLREKCDADPGYQPLLNIPGIVVCAFASECFLKCLGLLDGKEHVNWHNLSELFKRLDEATKEGIRQEWQVMTDATCDQRKELETHFKVSIPTDIETSLAECGDAFRLLRYIFERPKNATFYITHFPKVLHDYTLKRTGWDFSEKGRHQAQDR